MESYKFLGDFFRPETLKQIIFVTASTSSESFSMELSYFHKIPYWPNNVDTLKEKNATKTDFLTPNFHTPKISDFRK